MDRRDVLKSRRAQLSAAQRALLEERLRGGGGAGDAGQAEVIPRRPEGRDAPLSHSQQRLWMLAQLEPESRAYHEQVVLRLEGRLSHAALERTLEEIVRRHEVLRTTFALSGGVPVQRVGPPGAAVPIRPVARAAVEEAARAQAQAPFDLQRGPPWRALLLQLGDTEHVLVFTVHHIAYDGWSLGVLVRELAALYPAFAAGRPSPLGELPIQYADFAAWQREGPGAALPPAALSYWKERLRGLGPLELPADRPRPAVQTFRGRTAHHALPPALSDRLKAFSRQQGVTLFVTLLAGLKALLHRYSGQTDIAAGTPVANRPVEETEPLIGFFVNTLVLRTDVSGQPSFRELVRRVNETTLGALAHQELPFERLVSELAPERDLSRNPLFGVMFVLQNAPVPRIRLPELHLELLDVDRGVAKLDLTLSAIDREGGLSLALEYNTDLYRPETAARMLAHLGTLLEAGVERPDAPVSTLRMLDDAEREALRSRWNQTARPGEPPLVHRAFAAQARATPDAVAVEFEGRPLTYGALARRTSQLARRLRALGAGPEVRVGICLPRSPDLLAAALAVLEAGAAYVPLDPALPPARLRAILDDSGAALWITSGGGPPGLGEVGARRVAVEEELDGFDPGPPGDAASAESLAYLIYTSGSTGKPKGVEVPHGALAGFLASMRERPGLTHQDTVLALTTVAFDISCLELFLPLTCGARIVLAPDGVAGDGARLRRLIEASGVTVVQATPSTWRLLLAAGFAGAPSSLRILCGGEAVTPELAAELLPRCRELWNVYGPTEATVWAALGRVLTASEAPALERPVDNAQLHVLDEQLQLLPFGVPGELHIGGRALARGYHGLPALTAKGFVPDPFAPGERLYKTGDRARRLAGGRVEVLGRTDHQVKVRGHRVELGEIETVLGEHRWIAQVAVAVKGLSAGEAQLVAYVVAKAGAPERLEESWFAFARERLPEYMVPQLFVVLEKLPLTVSGKVDRRALPDPARGERPGETMQPPRDKDEELLASLFAEVLEREPPGIHQDFFHSGGHSLLAVQLIARIHALFHVELPVRALLERPTVAGVAAALRELRSGGAGALSPPPPPDLEAEARLPEDVCRELPAAAAARELPGDIFLTGPTGFLGPYVLAELLRATGARIHCLVRARTEEEGRSRVDGSLAALGVAAADRARVRIVLGDLTRPRLGLSGEQFAALGGQVDAVVHNGAHVNYVYPYAALKAANVTATVDLLRLASAARVKPFHFVSTTNVLNRFPAPASHVTWSEEDLRPAAELSTDGYVQSKWVAERLVLEARRRGLPAFIYRPNTVSGHSRTGAWNARALACRMLRACVALGAAPALAVPFVMTPVDYVAQALVHLAFGARPSSHAFHLVNPHPVGWGELVQWLRDFGYRLELLPYETWRKAALAYVPGLPPHAPEVEQRFDCRAALAGLAGTSIHCAPMSPALVATYCRWLADNGVLPAPGGDP